MAKYDASGQALWTGQLGTSDWDQSFDVAVDPGGNIFVSGYTTGSLDGQTSAGGDDAFVAKYDSSGSLMWTRQLGTSGSDISYGVAADVFDNVFISGATYGGLDGPSEGLNDAFLAKYDTLGSLLWTRQLGTPYSDESCGVAADVFDNVFISGYTRGNLDGQTSAGNSDAFVSKYDTSGSLMWTRQLGSVRYDSSNGVAADAFGNVFISGHTGGSLDGQTSAGGQDAFVAKYDSSGSLMWTRQLGTSNSDDSYEVAADVAGNIFISGATHGSLDGQTSAGGWDAFVAKFSVLKLGDVNGDGWVGGDDLTIILTNWGLDGQTREQGDLTGDLFVGGDDYTEVLTYWGTGTPPVSVVTAVPEPATLGLMLLGGLVLLWRRTG